jgi:hypothetical protein
VLGLLTTPGALTGGIDTMLTKAQAGLDKLGNDLPVVGTNLLAAEKLVLTFQHDLDNTLGALLGGGKLSVTEAIQRGLFDLFGPAPGLPGSILPHLNLLEDPITGDKPAAHLTSAQLLQLVPHYVQFSMTKDPETKRRHRRAV